MELTEKTLARKDIFKGRIIDVHVDDIELEDGSKSIREVIDHNGGVCVVALTEKDEVLLVRQFRYPYKEILTELPAGKLEKGEDPLEAIKREQLEETGTKSEDYVFLGNLYPTPAYCGEIIRIWATRITEYTKQKLDEGEFLEVDRVPIEKAVDMVLNNEIPDSKTQVGILKAYALIKTGKL
ncbi:MAG: NUDIX hydrolase [Clostridia bacterium]|nr:NUDIX hydrolase [Clostridia bacterium]